MSTEKLIFEKGAPGRHADVMPALVPPYAVPWSAQITVKHGRARPVTAANRRGSWVST